MMQLLTISDIARELGVSRQRAQQWAGREVKKGKRPATDFPEPVGRVGSKLVYEREAVIHWAESRGKRLQVAS